MRVSVVIIRLSRDGLYPPVQELAGGMLTLVMIKSVFPSLAVIFNSSK